MTGPPAVRAATRRYAVVMFLIWLPTGLYLAPMVLLMLERGLDLPTVAAVGAVYSVVVAALELPTGGLADVLGRRWVLVASAAFSLVGLLVLGLATTAWLFVAYAVCSGTARALASGPPDAWYVDTVHAAAGPDVDLGPGLARGQSASSVALAVGTLTGGLLPLVAGGAPVPALAVPVLLAAVVEAVRLVVTVLGLPEPPHPRPGRGAVLRGVPGVVRTGLRLGTRDAVLVRLLLVAVAAGVALAAVELLTPGWLAELTGTAEAGAASYAVVAAVGFAAAAAGSAVSARLARRAGGPARVAVAGAALAGTALLGLAVSGPLTATPAVVATGLAYCLLFLGFGIAGPAEANLLHGRVGAGERATVISVQSLLLQLAAAAGALGLGRLATAVAPEAAFGVAAVLLLTLPLALLRSAAPVPPPPAESAARPPAESAAVPPVGSAAPPGSSVGSRPTAVPGGS